MLISLNWIRRFVDLPAGVDAHALAERFTRTTAEVEGVEEISVGAKGLICARVAKIDPVAASDKVRTVTLDVGGGKTVRTISAAPVLHEGGNLVYAPAGSSIAAYGEIASTTSHGEQSEGMILPGEAIGISLAMQEAIFLSDEFAPGDALPNELFDDVVIEVDNKSITHRPDLWGHYGVAREIAAIERVPLKPYEVKALDELQKVSGSRVPIEIEDSSACPRFCGILLEGVPSIAAPLWMQLLLGHVGLRPITALVDLTNFLMLELGQPMHAYDAGKVSRIEVGFAKDGDTFRTLDGMDRDLTDETLMIRCGGENIGIAGVMGGLDSEVTEATVSLLLEAANFDAATVRKTAKRMGHTTDASRRFEKSLDPTNAALSIQRFIRLAEDIYPDMRVTSPFSDCFPVPPQPVSVRVNPERVSAIIGREISRETASELLSPIGFEVSATEGHWRVSVPSFRAGGDVGIEADIIEEIARFVGYDSIEPRMPEVSVRRFAPNALHDLEGDVLRYLSAAHAFNEIHGYLWYDPEFIGRIGYDPGDCVELMNPAADGQERLRKRLLPAVLSAVATNRFHFPEVSLLELGSVYPNEPGKEPVEVRHLALAQAKRGKRVEGEVLDGLKAAICGLCWDLFGQSVTLVAHSEAGPLPWIEAHRSADIVVGGTIVGSLGTAPLSLRQKMDEHLGAWGIAWAELNLEALLSVPRTTEALGTVPDHPLVDIDLSVVVPADVRFGTVSEKLCAFEHDLLRRLRFVGHYEGESIGAGRRSLTFRFVLGSDDRTLREDDANGFLSALEKHVTQCGYEVRK